MIIVTIPYLLRKSTRCLCHIRNFVMSSVEDAKARAAETAVLNWIQDGTVVGIGSGSTVVYAAKKIASLVKKGELSVKCVPTSFQSRQLIVEYGLTLTDLDTNPEIDCVVDGADEVDSSLNLIKGGGGCLLQEKIVASCSRKLIVIADYTKQSNKFGDKWKKGVPIEVVPAAYVPIRQKIEEQFGGKAVLRMAKVKAGPVVTDNGNFILDWQFNESEVFNWQEMACSLKMIPGVVETGLFIGMTTAVYFGLENGTVHEVLANSE